MKLRTQMVLIAMSLTLLGSALGLAGTRWALIHFRLADLDEDNRLLSQVIAEATLTEPRYEVPSSVNDYLVRSSGVSTAQVYLRGHLLWKGEVLEAPEPLDPQGLLGDEGPRTVGTWRTYTLSRDDITIQVGRRLTALQTTLQPFTAIAVPLSIALSLLSGALAWVAAGVVLRPLARLTQAAQNFNDVDEIPAVPGRGEAATLAQSFSALLSRLNAERRREQAFLAYAAHELRTPISALRSSLDAAWIRKVPLELERLGQLHREALRLETFAQNLLALANAEAGELRAKDLDLADLVAVAFDRFQTLALETDHELALEAGAAPVHADPRLLEQALNNLVSNALRHTPKGLVTLKSGIEEAGAYVEVADPGPGLSGVVKEGLGLRVVKSVAQAHEGTLIFDHEQGSRIRLQFPAESGARAGG